MRNLLNTLMVCALTAVALQASAEDNAVGQTLAVQATDGVVALTWDGEVARLFRGDVEIDSYQAHSWNAAMWAVDAPSYGTVSAPHIFDRALTAQEVAGLGACDWTASLEVVECGVQARCDCKGPALNGLTSL